MNSFFSLQFICLLIILTGCNNKYDLEACNELSMKRFKGFTDARKKFADNCMGFTIKYTEEMCQSALNDLIMKNDLSAVKTIYGNSIENCFTPQDLKKYDK